MRRIGNASVAVYVVFCELYFDILDMFPPGSGGLSGFGPSSSRARLAAVFGNTGA